MKTETAPAQTSPYLARLATVTAVRPLTDKEKLFDVQPPDGPLGHAGAFRWSRCAIATSSSWPAGWAWPPCAR